MIQEVLTYAIISFAVIYSLYSVIKGLTKKNKGVCSDSCSCGTRTELGKSFGKH